MLYNSNPKINENNIEFRATCERHGMHDFKSPEVASSFGSGINDKFKWKVNLKV